MLTCSLGRSCTYLKAEATNMISGMSKEKPALDLFLCIEYVWSEYEVRGDTTIKIGAREPSTSDTIPILQI